VLLTPRPPRSRLFPYTTLFRSVKSTSTVQSSTVASATGPDSSVLVAVLISVGNSNHLVPLRTSQIVCAIEWIGSSRYRRVLFPRSEEHTSELQSRENLVCRLLL